MYKLGVRRDLIAQHFLLGNNVGPEGLPHSHHYVIELQFEGHRLNEHGYLVDIDHVNAVLGLVIEHFKDHLLNDLPEFEDANPSVERFAHNIAARVNPLIPDETVTALVVKLWENESAWASFRLTR